MRGLEQGRGRRLTSFWEVRSRQLGGKQTGGMTRGHKRPVGVPAHPQPRPRGAGGWRSAEAGCSVLAGGRAEQGCPGALGGEKRAEGVGPGGGTQESAWESGWGNRMSPGEQTEGQTDERERLPRQGEGTGRETGMWGQRDPQRWSWTEGGRGRGAEGGPAGETGTEGTHRAEGGDIETETGKEGVGRCPETRGLRGQASWGLQGQCRRAPWCVLGPA